MAWVDLADARALDEAGRLLVRADGRQVLLLQTESGPVAIDNRCPHEGYPLSEATLERGCVLTCNWHNWKFDLASQETLIGGDRLRHFPLRLERGRILADLAPQPAEEIESRALAGLKESFVDHDQERMAREIGRLQAAGIDPLMALRQAIGWTHDHLEYGMTHALAAAPDWLALRDLLPEDDAAARLVPLVEIAGHLAWDTLRQPSFAYPTVAKAGDDADLLAAIEAQDDDGASTLLLGRLDDDPRMLRPVLAQAALAHYADFGHSVIYVQKAFELIERLGPATTRPILLALVRSLVHAYREDRLPEFRHYAPALDDEPKAADPLTADALRGVSARRAIDLVSPATANPLPTWHKLVQALAWNMLHFDLAWQDRADRPPADNVGWLDFTHGITFAHAVRDLASETPALWRPGLLQMALFVGRNAAYLAPDLDDAAWQVDAPASFIACERLALVDHGVSVPIVSAHLVKLTTAAAREIDAFPEAPWVPILAAAIHRFRRTPLKRRHTLRAARQALALVG